MKDNKKIELAQKLKAILNSPEYVAIPEIIGHHDRHGELIAFLHGAAVGESIHQKDNFIAGKKINPDRKGEENTVFCEELEPADWEEIVNLIQKRNEEKEQKFDQRWTEIQEKMNNTPGLYYFWGNARKGKRANVWCEREEKWSGIRGFLDFSGKENDQTHYLNIAEEHPILDNFSFKKGFYYIEVDKPIEKNSSQYWSDGGDDNPNNFHKWVELEDEITITPENGEKLVVKKTGSRKRQVSYKNLLDGENKSKKATGSAGDNSASKANRGENELVAVGKVETKSAIENKQLTQILHAIQNLEQRIVELEETGNNPQQVKTLKQQVKNLETQKAQISNNKQIKEPEVSTKTNESTNNQIANNSTHPNNNALLIVGGILIVGAALVIGYLLGKDNKTNQ